MSPPPDRAWLAAEAVAKWGAQFGAAQRLVTVERILRLVKLVEGAHLAEARGQACPHCGATGSWGNHVPECKGRRAALVLASLNESAQILADCLGQMLPLCQPLDKEGP